jgi:hypothetical protein
VISGARSAGAGPRPRLATFDIHMVQNVADRRASRRSPSSPSPPRPCCPYARAPAGADIPPISTWARSTAPAGSGTR